MAGSKEKKSTSAEWGDILLQNIGGSGICIYILFSGRFVPFVVLYMGTLSVKLFMFEGSKNLFHA
jgi:hypothetical protein